MPSPKTWAEFRTRARPTTDWSEVGLVLCLDPGETTGWARFLNGDLFDCGQDATPDPALMAETVRSLLGWVEVPAGELDRTGYAVSTLVYEEYRIRGSKAKQHVGSEVVTIQHIGVIKVVADDESVHLVKQTAGMAKGFATDDKLRRWGLYQTNMRHANDAIRHGVYWHLFGYRKDPRGKASSNPRSG